MTSYSSRVGTVVTMIFSSQETLRFFEDTDHWILVSKIIVERSLVTKRLFKGEYYSFPSNIFVDSSTYFVMNQIYKYLLRPRFEYCLCLFIYLRLFVVKINFKFLISRFITHIFNKVMFYLNYKNTTLSHAHV